MVQLGRAGRYIAEAVDGLKTLAVAAMFALLGLADYYDVVNIKPALDAVFGEDKAAKLMVFLPIVFGTLRFLSNSGPRWSKRWREAREAEPFDECNQKEPH